MGQTEVRQKSPLAEGAPSAAYQTAGSLIAALGLSRRWPKGLGPETTGFHGGWAPTANDAWVMHLGVSKQAVIGPVAQSSAAATPGHRRLTKCTADQVMVARGVTGPAAVLAATRDRGAPPADSAVPSPAGSVRGTSNAAGQGRDLQRRCIGR